MSDWPLLTAQDALDVLERFLDVTLDLEERVDALNDVCVPSAVLVAFLRTLDPDVRLRALLWCDRPEVLAAWVSAGTPEERRRVAANDAAWSQTIRALASDVDEFVRREIPFHPSVDLETLAWLLADPSAEVQQSLQAAFEAAEREPAAGVEDVPGDEESLAFLHDMVRAALEEDCAEEWADARRLAFQWDAVIALAHPELFSTDDGDDVHAAELEAETQEAAAVAHDQAVGILRFYLGAREF